MYKLDIGVIISLEKVLESGVRRLRIWASMSAS